MTLPRWLHYIDHSYVADIVKSILLIVVLIIIRFIVMRAISMNKHIETETKLRWSINLRNAALLIGGIGLIFMWSKELQSLALSMVAVAVATVIATKELIMCLGGTALRAISNSYGVGDRVEIGPYRGQVVDINLLSTTIMEIGPGHFVHQFSGRAVSMPNSILLTAPVIREDYMGEYVVHSIVVPVPYSVHINTSEKVLIEAAREICTPFLDSARDHMRQIQRRHLVDTPSVEPRIAVQPIDDKHYKLIVRVAIPAEERHSVEQAILHRFMQEAYEAV